MLDKKRRLIQKISSNRNDVTEIDSSNYHLESVLISQLLDLSRSEISLPNLAKKIINVMHQHMVLNNTPMALWCIDSQNKLHTFSTKGLSYETKKTHSKTIRYDIDAWYFLKRNASYSDNADLQRTYRTDFYLEKTAQHLLGINFWSETSDLEFKLDTPFFNNLLGMVNLILLKVLQYEVQKQESIMQKEEMRHLKMEDLSQKKNYEALLRHQASYDDLTSLPNRFYGYKELERAIASSAKQKKKIAILFIDLDEFKQINESLGHNVGDALLKTLAQRYLPLMQKTDTIVRLGGDEFMIILRELNHDKYAEEMAQKCQKLILHAFKLESQELYISSSIGIAYFPEHGLDAKTLMRNAEAAMYQSKVRGRNNWTVFVNTMAELVTNRIRIKSELRQVLKRDELYICYQPIINSANNQVLAAEALLRWNSATLGNVMPDQIIPIAEETGLIVPLGYWVLKKVCSQVKKLKEITDEPIKIAVNISTIQLKQKDFVDQVKKILEATEVSPDSLIFEITESAFIDDSKLILSQLNRLNEMNIHCSLDDFGMGYSSLSYIRSYPFKSLKIDKVFIQSIDTSSDDLSLVNSIITMSRNLKLVVIAEGIETSKQLELLRSMNCDMVQGWYFSEALSSDDLLVYLHNHCT